MLHKKDQKSSREKDMSTSRRHLPLLTPGCSFSFLFFSVSAIIGFLFSFTVFLVSLLHCEHLAIGVQALDGGGLSR